MIRIGDGDGEPPAFELAATETTLEQFLRCDPGHRQEREYGRRDDCPAMLLTWFDAVRYCRWLTFEDGLTEEDQCYPDPDTEGDVTLCKDFRQRRGFRLPTANEWEFACLGGSESLMSFGNEFRHVIYYGPIDPQLNETMSVTKAKPDAYGLFGMTGNVAEWCSDGDNANRSVRGVSFSVLVDSDTPYVIGRNTTGSSPTSYVGRSLGFRVARSR